MSDYIDREAISKRLEGMEIVGPLYYGIPVVEALDAIENMPAADARPVVRGEWVQDTAGWGGSEYVIFRCSKCLRAIPYDKYNFCPNCGADMRGGAE